MPQIIYPRKGVEIVTELNHYLIVALLENLWGFFWLDSCCSILSVSVFLRTKVRSTLNFSFEIKFPPILSSNTDVQLCTVFYIQRILLFFFKFYTDEEKLVTSYHSFLSLDNIRLFAVFKHTYTIV